MPYAQPRTPLTPEEVELAFEYLLALLGITPPEGLDGRVVADLLRQTESVKVRDRAAGAALP